MKRTTKCDICGLSFYTQFTTMFQVKPEHSKPISVCEFCMARVLSMSKQSVESYANAIKAEKRNRDAERRGKHDS